VVEVELNGPLKGVADILRRSVSGLPPYVRAELVLQGKRESFFRDLFARSVAVAAPGFLCKPEWDIPREAVARWNSHLPSAKKTKGIVDLAILTDDALFADQPVSLIEFKLWYTLDAVSPSKYSGSARTHLSIPKAAAADHSKIRAVRGGRNGYDFLVTYLLTAHVDRRDGAEFPVKKSDVERTGMAYAAAHCTKALLQEGFDSVRERGIKTALASISEACGETAHVGLGNGYSRGVPVSLDCLITVVR
jgi:hypothetical protein